MTILGKIGGFLSEKRWRAAAQRASERALDVAPSLLADGVPFVGGALAKGLDSPSVRARAYEGRLNTLLVDLSLEVDGFFKRYCEESSGLNHDPVNIGSNSNVVISRAVAFWLNSIADPNKSPASSRELGVALLFERIWQSKDAESLHDLIQNARLNDALRFARGVAEDVLTKAIHLQQHTLKIINNSEVLAKAFTEYNGGLSVPEVRLQLSTDLKKDASIIEQLVLQVADPKENIKQYLRLLCSDPFGETAIATSSRYPGAGSNIQKSAYPVSIPIGGKGSPGYANNQIQLWRYPIGADRDGLLDLSLMDKASPVLLDSSAPFESRLFFEGDRFGCAYEDTVMPYIESSTNFQP